jgi:hypothetical protein
VFNSAYFLAPTHVQAPQLTAMVPKASAAAHLTVSSGSFSNAVDNAVTVAEVRDSLAGVNARDEEATDSDLG